MRTRCVLLPDCVDFFLSSRPVLHFLRPNLSSVLPLPKVTMALEDPYHEADGDDESDEDSDEEYEVQARRKKAKGIKKEKVMHVDIDMALSAYANSRALYEAKKKATDKASKTVQGTSLSPPRDFFGRGE